MKRKTEQRFEYRISRILIGKGWLVLNVARSRPFDLAIFKNGLGVPVELKSRFTAYPLTQQELQGELCRFSKSGFVLIQQLYERNKRGFKIEPNFFGVPDEVSQMLRTDLEDFM